MAMGVPRLLAVVATALVATPVAAQEAPTPLTDLSRSKAGRAIETYFAAADDAGRQAALELADSLGPLTAGDAELLVSKVRIAMRLHGSKYRGKGDGSEDGAITFPEYPELKGRYRVQGRLDGTGVPLFVGLHGGGATGGDSSRAVRVFRDVHANSIQCYPTAMKLEADAWNTPREEQYVLALIDQMVRTYDIDTNRIYLAGTSMGGFGVWSTGTAHPDRFAALASGAGGIIPMRRKRKFYAQPGWVENLYNTPIWFYHSADDPRVPPHGDRAADRALEILQGKFPGGYDYVYKEYTDRGHGAPPLGHRPILQWMFAQRRNPTPERIRWRPARPSKRQCYWLRWPAPTIEGKRSTEGPMIDAQRAGNAITVTGAPKGLQLLLRDGMVDLTKPVKVTINGREVWSATPPRTLRTMLETARESRDPELVFTARVAGPN
ncbi:MAG: carboxylesterase family protein [Planctomycetota bacterium]|jgi:predicted esterase